MLRKMAVLAVRKGLNVKDKENVLILSPIIAAPLVREIVRECYEAGANKVVVKYSDEETNKEHYIYQKEEELCNIPEYIVGEHEYYVEKKFSRIKILSPVPHIMDEVDPLKQQKASLALQKKIDFAQEFIISNNVSWTIVAYANEKWAAQIFPNLPKEEALKKLWDAIFLASRIEDDWEQHLNNLENYYQKMNAYNFEKIIFKNSKGTNLEVGLVRNHLWAGGREYTIDGKSYVPNIPTEEIFTMPHKYKTNGIVYSSKPLEYHGKIIKDFYFEFKDGKVINFDALENKDALAALLSFDEASCYLGEVALISHNTPISQMNILFYNTLFDENASCHLALGSAYKMNVKKGLTMSKEELLSIGYNDSLLHVDFMFGSSDMKVIGITDEGKEIMVFDEGNFVI